MAIACLRLLTFLPLRPLLRVPRLRLRIARSTSFEALREYRRAMVQFPVDQTRAGDERTPARTTRLHSEPAGINGEGSLLVPESSSRTALTPRGVAGRLGAGGVAMASRIRIDRLLVERGLFESRAKAQAAIAAGRVTADDVMVEKSSDEISADATLRAEPAHPYVSRGGVKLAAALDHFRFDPMFDPRGRVCLDVGASTGGFTDVLLARGARAGLCRRCRSRPAASEPAHAAGDRVRSKGPTFASSNRRGLPSGPTSSPSMRASSRSSSCCRRRSSWRSAPACLLALIKPQFEAGRRNAKKGIVRDPLVSTPRSATISRHSSRRSAGTSPASSPPRSPAATAIVEFFIAAHRT